MSSDLQEMQAFSQFMLDAVVEFLSTPPVFYVFGLCLFLFVCKAFKILFSFERRTFT